MGIGKVIDEETLKKVHQMADIGIRDQIISKKLGIGLGSVTSITTKYWQNKMANKKDYGDYV
jgi:hypothetical protein